VRVLAQGGLQRGHDHVLDLIQQDRRRPARPRLIMQTLQPPGDEPGPPPLHRRRPARAASSSPASRWSANWRRHLDTDLTATPSACAAVAVDIPPAQARTIQARSARQRPGPLARRTSSARSSSDSTIGTAERPGMTAD
jgi:hypothetical protein